MPLRGAVLTVSAGSGVVAGVADASSLTSIDYADRFSDTEYDGFRPDVQAIPFTSAECRVLFQEECFKGNLRTRTFSLAGLGVYVSAGLFLWAVSEYVFTDFLTCVSAFGDRGNTPSWFHGAGGWVCSLLYTVHQMLPLLPCTVQLTELPATTEGESSRGGSSQGHKAGPLTERFLLVVLPRVQGVCFKPRALIIVGSGRCPRNIQELTREVEFRVTTSSFSCAMFSSRNRKSMCLFRLSWKKPSSESGSRCSGRNRRAQEQIIDVSMPQALEEIVECIREQMTDVSIRGLHGLRPALAACDFHGWLCSLKTGLPCVSGRHHS